MGWNLPFDPWRYSNCGMRSQRWKMTGNVWSVTWGYSNNAGAIPEVNPEGLELWYTCTVFNTTHFTVNFFNPTIQKDTCLSLGQVRKLKQEFSQSHTATRQGGTYLSYQYSAGRGRRIVELWVQGHDRLHSESRPSYTRQWDPVSEQKHYTTEDIRTRTSSSHLTQTPIFSHGLKPLPVSYCQRLGCLTS